MKKQKYTGLDQLQPVVKVKKKKEKRKLTPLKTSKRKASTRSISTKDFQRELFG